MICYILLTYGRKPSGQIRDHPAARTQIALFAQLLDPHQVKKAKFVCDYARSIDSLASLPDLHRHLVLLKGMGKGEVVIDDLSRLVRKVALGQRVGIFSELRDYGEHLFSMRHNKKLSDFSSDEIMVLLQHAEKSKSPAKQRRHRDTDKARASSLETRQRRAVSTANPIKELRREILDSEVSATSQMVADRANALGMRTSTGKEWTRQNVARALKS